MLLRFTLIESIKSNFPQSTLEIEGNRLVYLDSAATTLKAKSVIDRLSKFYLYESANVHRGAHVLSDRATSLYEQSRTDVKNFINANSPNEIVFTRGTTEAINIVARGLKSVLTKGSKILLTELEHHSNIVPWQIICQELDDVKIEYVKIDKNGDLNLEDLKEKICEKTKILSFTACSNVLGTINPVKKICAIAKQNNIITVVDAAQWVAARPTDVQDLDCDYLAFSGHKIFAPFGIGVLYGKYELLNSMPPYQGGGSMINHVDHNKSTYLEAPFRFEAGTPNVGGAIALAEALNYVKSIGFNNILDLESKLMTKTLDQLLNIEGLKVFGAPNERSNIISFSIDGAHHSDIGTLLDKQGIAIRTGHHCCQLLMKKLNVTGTARIAFSIYNDEFDIDAFIKALNKVREFI